MSGRPSSSLCDAVGLTSACSPSIDASPDNVTLATILAELRRLVERMDGKLDTVEDRIERLEERWLPHTRVDTPSTAERGTASTANTDRATITHPNSVSAAAAASAALSTTATGHTTTIRHSVTTPTAFISPLTMTRSPPPSKLLRASSTAPRPPRFPAHKQASTSDLEPAAAYASAIDRATTTPPPVSTSAAAISPLATTSSTPPPMAQHDSSTTAPLAHR